MDWFVVVSALSLAAMYGLLGVGISLTWASIGMLNLANGFTFAAAGYGAFWASQHLVTRPISLLDAAIVGVSGILTGVAAGLVIGAIAFLPLHDRPNFPIRSLIATLAISLAATQIFLITFGPLSKPLPRLFDPVGKLLDRPNVKIGHVVVTWDRIGAIVFATLLLALVILWMRTSRRGIQMRAMMQDPEGAALVAVSVRSTGMLVLGISGALTGLAAVLLSQTFFVSPQAGVLPLAKGLVIALLGGLGSIPGAFIAAVLVGLCEALTAKYFGTNVTLFAQYVLVFAVLTVRPRGIGGLLDQVRH